MYKKWMTFVTCIFAFQLGNGYGDEKISNLYRKSQDLVDKGKHSRLVGKVMLSPKIEVLYSVDTTSKGNGVIQIGGQCIQSWDDHDEGKIFKGTSLNHTFVDVNADGVLDLLLSGTAIITNEKTGETESEEIVASVFVFDKKSKTFVLKLKSPYLRSFVRLGNGKN